MKISELTQAVSDDAAFRRRLRLQPVGGVGDRVYGPTYPAEGRDTTPRHVFETRRVAGESVETSLLDSVQSSANRAEEALLDLVRAGEIELPMVAVDFSGTQAEDIGQVTSLDAPHRVFDAILRDSTLDGTPFMRSKVGEQLQLANTTRASAIFEASPTALLFGAWNSTGEGGGLGAKFPRAYVSEIFAVNVPVEREGNKPDPISAARRTSSRIDPLGILRDVSAYAKPGADWQSKEEKGFKKVRASEVNHGNIRPSVQPLSVTMDYAEQVMAVSFAGLRRLRFGSDEQNKTARAVLAALGLVAHYAHARTGYALRSRCDLVPEGPADLQLVKADGTTSTLAMDLASAIALYGDAVKQARAAGFTYAAAPIILKPQEKLVAIVIESRQLALAGKGGSEESIDAGSGS